MTPWRLRKPPIDPKCALLAYMVRDKVSGTTRYSIVTADSRIAQASAHGADQSAAWPLYCKELGRNMVRSARKPYFNKKRGIEKGSAPNTLEKVLEDATNELSITSRQFIQMLLNMIEQQSQQMKHIEQQLHSLVCERDDYQRLLSVPGVGPVVAATVLASVNDMSSFKNGRQFACWVGLTPTQYASGELNRIGKISKRGNPHTAITAAANADPLPTKQGRTSCDQLV